MFVRQKTRPARRPSGSSPVAKRRSRGKAPLDAAGLLLELDMRALIKESEASLRQHRDERGARGWWRRLFYAKRTA